MYFFPRASHGLLISLWVVAKTWLVQCLPKVGKGGGKIGPKALIFLILPQAAPFCVGMVSPEGVELLLKM